MMNWCKIISKYIYSIPIYNNVFKKINFKNIAI